jgi:hypothetical protein
MAFLQHQVGHALRMAARERHSHAAASARHSEEGESLEARCFDDGFKVFGEFGGRELYTSPIRQPAAAPVISDKCSVTGQEREPGTPDRTFPIKLEVVDPMLRPH